MLRPSGINRYCCLCFALLRQERRTTTTSEKCPNAGWLEHGTLQNESPEAGTEKFRQVRHHLRAGVRSLTLFAVPVCVCVVTREAAAACGQGHSSTLTTAREQRRGKDIITPHLGVCTAVERVTSRFAFFISAFMFALSDLRRPHDDSSSKRGRANVTTTHKPVCCCVSCWRQLAFASIVAYICGASLDASSRGGRLSLEIHIVYRLAGTLMWT